MSEGTRSAGRPSEDAITEDLRTLYARVVARPVIDRERLVCHGRSVGGAVGTLVRAHPPRARSRIERFLPQSGVR